MAPRSRRFAPRLEGLDDRSLPSVSYALSGTFRFVTGDDGNNVVTIRDTGTESGIEVIGDGVPYTATSPITHVFVDTGVGNDTVEYDLTTSLTTNRLIDVRLGRGADVFTANIAGQTVGEWVSLAISAYGGGGGDTMALNAQGVSTNPNSILNVFFSGDAGKDKITFDYSANVELGSIFLKKDQRR